MKVSVVITSYNLAEYIDDCVKSVMQQSIMPDEIILADDASTDNTIEIAKEKCPNLIIIKQEKDLPTFITATSNSARSIGRADA